MEQEEIDYIVEWFESGNEPREDSKIPEPIYGSYAVSWAGYEDCRLNNSGITIAKLAIENRKLREELEPIREHIKYLEEEAW